jgi:hypothetical protein
MLEFKELLTPLAMLGAALLPALAIAASPGGGDGPVTPPE